MTLYMLMLTHYICMHYICILSYILDKSLNVMNYFFRWSKKTFTRCKELINNANVTLGWSTLLIYYILNMIWFMILVCLTESRSAASRSRHSWGLHKRFNHNLWTIYKNYVDQFHDNRIPHAFIGRKCTFSHRYTYIF